MSNNIPAATPSQEELDKAAKNLTKLSESFEINITHKDEDSNEGETQITISAPTVLGAISCLQNFHTFRENGWKSVLVNELFDVSEKSLVNNDELDARLTQRIQDENRGEFREGVLTLTYVVSHPLLKEAKTETLSLRYRYNQILHLVQMINTVLTENFSSGIIEGVLADLDSGKSSNQHYIKL